MGRFERRHPELVRPFKNSIFAAATVNFGPQTVCLNHRDTANLPFGWCAISALGKFNSKRGGHLVLWDLKLVIEFPPGITIIIPSAVCKHSNTVISPNETRYSFTQYSAGGIFRWVEHGFQLDEKFYAELDKGSEQEKRAEAVERQSRWKRGLAMFSTLSELRKQYGTAAPSEFGTYNLNDLSDVSEEE
jgi:hypothetical protein